MLALVPISLWMHFSNWFIFFEVFFFAFSLVQKKESFNYLINCIAVGSKQKTCKFSIKIWNWKVVFCHFCFLSDGKLKSIFQRTNDIIFKREEKRSYLAVPFEWFLRKFWACLKRLNVKRSNVKKVEFKKR